MNINRKRTLFLKIPLIFLLIATIVVVFSIEYFRKRAHSFRTTCQANGYSIGVSFSQYVSEYKSVPESLDELVIKTDMPKHHIVCPYLRGKKIMSHTYI